MVISVLQVRTVGTGVLRSLPGATTRNSQRLTEPGPVEPSSVIQEPLPLLQWFLGSHSSTLLAEKGELQGFKSSWEKA